jgi:hypothetical protein
MKHKVLSKQVLEIQAKACIQVEMVSFDCQHNTEEQAKSMKTVKSARAMQSHVIRKCDRLSPAMDIFDCMGKRSNTMKTYASETSNNFGKGIVSACMT